MRPVKKGVIVNEVFGDSVYIMIKMETKKEKHTEIFGVDITDTIMMEN